MLSLPPAFVLSQDQTLRLTSLEKPQTIPAKRPRQPETPELINGILSIKRAKSSNETQHQPSKNQSSSQTNSRTVKRSVMYYEYANIKRPQCQNTKNPDNPSSTTSPPPAYPFHHQQCQTAGPNQARAKATCRAIARFTTLEKAEIRADTIPIRRRVFNAQGLWKTRSLEAAAKPLGFPCRRRCI